jgi:hypothetical protein
MSLSLRIQALGTILVGCLSFTLLAQDAPPVPPNAIAQGSVMLIQLTDRLDTHTVKSGDAFHARVAEALTAPNGVTIEAGRKLKGHVSSVLPGMHTRLLLSFDEVDTGHGWVPLFATVTGVPGEHGLQQIGEEGEIGRKGMTKEQIAEAVVIGAGEGAAEGMHNGGGKRGAASGAGAGAANSGFEAFESGHDLVLDKGTALEIRLDRNLTIPSR